MRCKKSFHGCCTKTTPEEVTIETYYTKKKTTRNQPRKLVKYYKYTECCQFCKEEEEKEAITHEEECPICHQGEYLNATITETLEELPQAGEYMVSESPKTRCHLICALLSPRHKLQNYEKFEFVKQGGNEEVSLVHECQICSKEVIDGASCKEVDCRNHVHIRCAEKQRSDFTTKNRDKVLREVELVAFKGLEYYWSVSHGCFKKKGMSDAKIQIKEEDLNKSYFFQKFSEDLKHKECLKNSVVRDVIQDLNSSNDTLNGGRKHTEEDSLDYKAYCPDHKKNTASYCLCGIMEETAEKEDDDSVTNGAINSICCDHCCTWYHRHCLSLEPDLELETFKCSKCERLELLFDDYDRFHIEFKLENLKNQKKFEKRNNFIKERQKRILKRDNIHLIDYLVVLEGLNSQLEKLKFEDLNYWQEEIPFSIYFLRKKKYQTEFVQDSVIKHYVKNMKNCFKKIIEKHSKNLSKFEEIKIKNLAQEYKMLKHDVYLFLAEFQHDPNLYKKFEELEEAMDKISKLFDKVSENSCSFNTIWELYLQLNNTGFLKNNNIDFLLRNLMIQISNFLDVSTEKLKLFQHRISGLDIFNLRKSDFNEMEKFGDIFVEKNSFVEKIKKNYQEQKSEIKKAESCMDINSLKLHFKEAIESLFFSDFQGIEEVKKYAKYYKRVTDWTSKYEFFMEKMKFMQNIKNEDFFMDSNFDQKILLQEEYKDLQTEDNYSKVIDYKFKKRIKTTLKGSEINCNNFEEVFAKVIGKGYPVNSHNLKILKIHGIMLKINKNEEDKEKNIRVSEEELDFFIQNTNEEDGMGISSARKACKLISNLVKEVRSKGYPSILKKEEKYSKITSTYRRFEKFGLKGKSWNKIQTVMGPIQWLDRLIEAYKDNKLFKQRRKNSRLEFIDNFRKTYLPKANDKILQEFSMLNETKEKRTETTGFKQFPDLKDIYRKMNVKYHDNMIGDFKKQDRYAVNQMLKIIRLRYLLELNSMKDTLFENRVEKVSNFIRGVTDLRNAEFIQVYEFCQEVEGLYSESIKLTDIPKSDHSYVKKCMKWLNQVKIVTKILKSIRKFKPEDLNRELGCEKFREMYYVVNSEGFKKLGILSESDEFEEKMNRFLAKMEEMQSLENDFRNVMSQIDEVRMGLTHKNLKKFSEGFINLIGRLPKRKKIEHLMNKMKDYRHLKDKSEQLNESIDQLDKTNKHLQDSFRKLQIFKTNENYIKKDILEKFNSTYIRPYLSKRLSKLRTIDQDTIEKIKVIWLTNFGAGVYLKKGIAIEDLKKKLNYFREIFGSLKDERNKEVLYDIRIEELIQDKLNKASVLSEKLYENPEIEIDDFFATLNSVRVSEVNILREEGTNIEEYFRIIGQLREAYKKKKKNLADILTREEISSINEFIFPKKLRRWVNENYSRNSFVKDWALKLSKCDRMNGIEVKCLLEHYKKGDYLKDETFKILDQEYEKTLNQYAYINVEANNNVVSGKIFEIEEFKKKFENIKMPMFDQELKIFSDIFLGLYKTLIENKNEDKIPVKRFENIFDFFKEIESLIKNGQIEFQIFTLGREIKEEVKEEIMIKTEIGERSKAFGGFLDHLSLIGSSIKTYDEVIRNITMETMGKCLPEESNDEPRTEERVENYFLENLKLSKEARNLKLIEVIDFKELIREIYDFVLEDQNSSISIFGTRSEYLEGLEAGGVHDSSETKQKIAQYLEEETESLILMIKEKGEERIKNHSLEDILRKQSTRKKSNHRKNHHIRKKPNGFFFKKKHKKLKNFDMKKKLDEKVRQEFTRNFGLDFDLEDEVRLLQARIIKEIREDRSRYDDFNSALKLISTKIKNKTKKQKLIEHLIDFMNEQFENNYSLIMKLKNLDLRIFSKKSFLKKRKHLKKLLSQKIEAIYKIDFLQLNINIIDRNENLIPLSSPSTKFLTKISKSTLKKISLPVKQMNIDLKNWSEIPEWVDQTLNYEFEKNQFSIIYGTLEGEIPKFTNKIQFRANLGDELAEVKMLITKGCYLPEKILRKLKYAKKNNLDTAFFIIDLSEVNCNHEKKLKFEFYGDGGRFEQQVYRKKEFFSAVNTPRVKGKKKKIMGFLERKKAAKTTRVSPKKRYQ